MNSKGKQSLMCRRTNYILFPRNKRKNERFQAVQLRRVFTYKVTLTDRVVYIVHEWNRIGPRYPT